MPSRAARWALVAAGLMLCWPYAAVSAAAPDARTRIGIFGGGHQDSLTAARALGVRYMRMTLALDGSDKGQLARIQDSEAAGFKLNIQFNDLAATATSPARFTPVTDDSAYERALGAALDATHPRLVTIQNEEDGPRLMTGAPWDYLHELTDAVRVAHARGYEISNGGLSAEGAKLAYWHHLWTGGQHAAADAFARRSLGPNTPRGRVISDELPSSASPNRPILGRTPLIRDKLARVEALVAGYRATGADYVNFHWFESDTEDFRAVATWLSQSTGLPAICNEMGQYSANADTVTALLSVAESLHLAYVMWFSADGYGPSVGLTDTNGALRANGQAFRAFVALHR